jgi:hypothetical protein
MITQEQAERIAGEITGQAHGSGDQSWELVEFDAGWLIRESWAGDTSLRGGALRVIERENGRVMRFPSSVPPGRILTEYAQVVERGRVESPA